MIRITVELFPGGNAAQRRTLATADIWNTGEGDAKRGAYGYVLYKKNGTRLRSGHVQWFHRRAASVWKLIAAVLYVAFTEGSVFNPWTNRTIEQRPLSDREELISRLAHDKS